MAKVKEERRSIDEVYSPIAAKDAAALLGWSSVTALNNYRNDNDIPEEWRWVKGFVFTQVAPRGPLMFNRFALISWHIARSINDPSIYHGAMARYWEAVRSA
jgi:hypothetical protein